MPSITPSTAPLTSSSLTSILAMASDDVSPAKTPMSASAYLSTPACAWPISVSEVDCTLTWRIPLVSRL
jgi:hypothetical protein